VGFAAPAQKKRSAHPPKEVANLQLIVFGELECKLQIVNALSISFHRE